MEVVEKECAKMKAFLYEQMEKIYSAGGKVHYPELSESFRNRDISY